MGTKPGRPQLVEGAVPSLFLSLERGNTSDEPTDRTVRQLKRASKVEIDGLLKNSGKVQKVQNETKDASCNTFEGLVDSSVDESPQDIPPNKPQETPKVPQFQVFAKKGHRSRGNQVNFYKDEIK